MAAWGTWAQTRDEVSAVLGDQFCAANQPLLAPTFAAFYLAINAGAFLCTGPPRGRTAHEPMIER